MEFILTLIESLGLKEALAAFVTITIPAGLVAYFKYRTPKDEPLTHDQKEEKLRESGKDFVSYLSAWNSIERDIQELLDTTPLDRFVMLRAWNGVRDPDKTTAIYQYKSESDKYMDFNYVELDHDYRSRLKRLYDEPISFSTESISDSLIKKIYRAEGIKSAVWYHIMSDSIHGVEERSVTYCSFGSSTLDGLDEITLMKSELLVSKIRGVMHKFRDS